MFCLTIVGSFGLKIIDAAGGDRKVGFAYFAMMVSVIFIVCSAITVINCKEKKVIMIVIPAILSALCYVFYKGGYKLTGEFYEKMICELRARKEQ